MKKLLVKNICFWMLGLMFTPFYAQQKSKPNIVIFYVDDLGYGDISANGAKGVITPNIDRLSKNGLNFTDAHSSSATCTPSRYSLITGSYAFRAKAAVLPGNASLIIDPSVRTMPMIVHWPGTVEPGISHALPNQTDHYASLAKLVGQDLRPNDAPDSEEHLDAWLGKNHQGRKLMLEETFTYAIRSGKFKYIHPKNNLGAKWIKKKLVDPGLRTQPQPFNLEKDLGETITSQKTS